MRQLKIIIKTINFIFCLVIGSVYFLAAAFAIYIDKFVPESSVALDGSHSIFMLVSSILFLYLAWNFWKSHKNFRLIAAGLIVITWAEKTWNESQILPTYQFKLTNLLSILIPLLTIYADYILNKHNKR